MLLLVTLGLLILSLLVLKAVLFPDAEKISLARTKFLEDATKDPNFPAVWAVIFLIMLFLFAGIQAVYLGFAVNFLLATGIMLAKIAAFVASGMFLVALGIMGHMLTKMFKNVGDPIAFRDVILPFPTFGKTLYALFAQTVWISFYGILTYFLLQ